MLDIKQKPIVWLYEDKLDKTVVDITEISEGSLMLKVNGKITKSLMMEISSFLFNYSNKIGRKINLIIDNSNILSICVEARLWLITAVKDGSPIYKANSFGHNIFIENTLLILINIISEADDVYHQLDNEDEALKWICII